MTGQEPTARQVFEDLAAEHLNQPGAGRRSMFGRDCLTVDGRNVAFFHDDRLAIKPAPEAAAALLATGDAVTPVMGERPMRDWVSFPLSDDPAAPERWRGLISDAVASARGH